MSASTSDTELGQLLRAKAASLGYEPEALLALAAEAAERQRWSVVPNFGSDPQMICHDILGPEHLAAWPDWGAWIIPVGSHIEVLAWNEGTIVYRLVSPQGKVLAASIYRYGESPIPTPA